MTNHTSVDASRKIDVTNYINFVSMLFGVIGNFICIWVLMQKPMLKRKFNWL